MKTMIFPDRNQANTAAADLLAKWLTAPQTRNVMLPGGNTPLPLYQLVAARNLPMQQLNIFALDEYVGVPLDEPRNCANLIRRTAVEPWSVPSSQYFSISSAEAEAATSVARHEQRIAAAGGLDILVLGLGQNGHLGFNEPGSAEDSPGRVVELDAVSIAANRQWFNGDYVPSRGATAGLKTLLAARHILMLAYGSHKSAAVRAMIEGPRTEQCPASLLQGHRDVHVFLDHAAATALATKS
jgi:glucosamine-6-phosphate deaminase